MPSARAVSISPDFPRGMSSRYEARWVRGSMQKPWTSPTHSSLIEPSFWPEFGRKPITKTRMVATMIAPYTTDAGPRLRKRSNMGRRAIPRPDAR